MTSAVASISLFNLGMVCDFVLEEVSDMQTIHRHYAQMPFLTPNQQPTEAQKAWFRQEEGRTRRYIFLASAIVRQQLLVEALPDPIDSKSPKQTSSHAPKTHGSQIHSISTKPQTPVFLHSENSIPTTVAAPILPAVTQIFHRQQNANSYNKISNTDEPADMDHVPMVSVLPVFSFPKPRTHESHSPPKEAFTPPPMDKRCTLYHDILNHAFANFPMDVFHHLLYSSLIGMSISVETLIHAVVIFSDAMKSRTNRDTFLMLQSLAQYSCCRSNAPSSHESSPISRASIDDRINCSNKYGADRMWACLESQLRSQQKRPHNITSKGSCDCFCNLEDEELHALQWNMFEGMVGCLLAALVLAVKMSEDSLWSNQCWAKISGFSLKDINHLELVLFQALNSSVNLECDRYLAFVANFCSSRCSTRHLAHAAQAAVAKARARGTMSFSYHALSDLESSRSPSGPPATPQNILTKEMLDEKRKNASGAPGNMNNNSANASQVVSGGTNGTSSGTVNGFGGKSTLPAPPPQSLVLCDIHSRNGFHSHHHTMSSENASLSRRPSVPVFFGAARSLSSVPSDEHLPQMESPTTTTKTKTTAKSTTRSTAHSFHMGTPTPPMITSPSTNESGASSSNLRSRSNSNSSSNNAKGGRAPWTRLMFGSLKRSCVAEVAAEEEAISV